MLLPTRVGDEFSSISGHRSQVFNVDRNCDCFRQVSSYSTIMLDTDINILMHLQTVVISCSIIHVQLVMILQTIVGDDIT